MKKILSLLDQITKNIFVHNMMNVIKIVISCVFYLFMLVSIVIAVGDIFYIQLYSFAAKELLLSFEIIMLMIVLYWAKQYDVSVSMYRVLWILTVTKIFFMMLMLSNLQKVADFEDCSDVEYCKSWVHTDINQANCLNDNGAWNIDENACDYRYYSKGNCEKRAGNWVYPDVCKGR